MTDDLDTLRPEVREALDRLVYFLTGTHNHNDFYAIRAELLRLADERYMAITELQYYKQLLAVEAELAALKARIAGAPVYEIPLSKPKSEDGWARVIESVKNERSVRGKRVRLVVEE